MELSGVKSGHSFLFYKNKNAIWRADLVRSVWGQEIEVTNLLENKVVATVTKKMNLIFNGLTIINFNERLKGKELIIPFKFFTPSIKFNYEDKNYEFVEHSNLLNSIFCGKEQIGMYTKKRLKFFNQDGVYIKLNSDVDELFVICILLIADIDLYNSGGMVTVNLGNLIVTKRKFNSKWKPY